MMSFNHARIPQNILQNYPKMFSMNENRAHIRLTLSRVVLLSIFRGVLHATLPSITQ